jgi:ABC-2 type transport system permease protein
VTDTSLTAPAPITRPTGDRYGLANLVRAETLKITTLSSSLWTLLITLFGAALITILSTNHVAHHAFEWGPGWDPTNRALGGVFFGILTMGVFGILVITSEYASGTIRTSLSATPRRPLFLAGKAAVAGAAMVVIGQVLSWGTFFLGQAILSGGGAPTAHLDQAGVARAIIFSGLFLALLGLMGMGVGFVIRNTAGAISTYVGLTFILPLILHQLSGQPDRFAPVQMLSSSVSVTVMDHTQVSPIVGLLLMAGYAAVALVAGAVMFVSRDA